MAEKEQKEKALQRAEQNEQRVKKYNELLFENKRKHKILQDKIAEIIKLKEELETVKDKAKERDQVYAMNKELVTK